MSKVKKRTFRDKDKERFASETLDRFLSSNVQKEDVYVIPHTSTRYRDAKGRFRKLPPNGKKPRGWKKVTIQTFTDTSGRPTKKPENLDLVSNRWQQFREIGSKVWKNADKTDFRKQLYSRIVEQRGDRKQPHSVYLLNNGDPMRWTKHDKAETKKLLIPELVTDKKLELMLEGSTVREALNKYNWEIAEYGQEVHIQYKVHYYYQDYDGNLNREKFGGSLIEDWISAPNLGRTINGEFEPGSETYGSILSNHLGNDIRSGFARNQVRFTTLDALTDLYDQGLIDDDLFETLEDRFQAEKVKIFLMIRIRNKKKK